MPYYILQEITLNISFAPIGLLNMFNASGAIEQCEIHKPSDTQAEQTTTTTIALKVRGCGRFGAYCSQRPLKCTIGGVDREFEYDSASGLVTLEIPAPEEEMYRWLLEIQV